MSARTEALSRALVAFEEAADAAERSASDGALSSVVLEGRAWLALAAADAEVARALSDAARWRRDVRERADATRKRLATHFAAHSAAVDAVREERLALDAIDADRVALARRLAGQIGAGPSAPRARAAKLVRADVLALLARVRKIDAALLAERRSRIERALEELAEATRKLG